MRCTILPIFLLLGSIQAAFADWIVKQKVEGGMNSGEMTLWIKDDKARLDVSNQISVLTDLATGDSITLNHNAKVLLRIPATEAAKVRESALGLKPGGPEQAPKLAATNRNEKVENHECEIFTWQLGDLQVTDWIARDYPNFQSLQAALARFQNAGLAKAAQPLMPPPDQFPGMVIRREMNVRGTKTTTTLLSAKEETLDEKRFAPPSDYKEQPVLRLPPAEPEKE